MQQVEAVVQRLQVDPLEVHRLQRAAAQRGQGALSATMAYRPAHTAADRNGSGQVEYGLGR
jgi:hypothetical protein